MPLNSVPLHAQEMTCAECGWTHRVHSLAVEAARRIRDQYGIDWICSYCEQYGMPRCHPFGDPAHQHARSSLAPCPECASGGSYEAFLRGM